MRNVVNNTGKVAFTTNNKSIKIPENKGVYYREEENTEGYYRGEEGAVKEFGILENLDILSYVNKK